MRHDSEILNFKLYCDMRNPLNITFREALTGRGHGIEA
jgi:hypothetical protein